MQYKRTPDPIPDRAFFFQGSAGGSLAESARRENSPQCLSLAGIRHKKNLCLAFENTIGHFAGFHIAAPIETI
jgi:hypothetical protein